MKYNKPLDFELEFSNRPHPFETFEMLELPKLANVDRTRYFESLVKSKNSSVLAYYLFINSDFSCSPRAAAISCFLKFI